MEASARAPTRRRTRAVAKLELDEISRKRQRMAAAAAERSQPQPHPQQPMRAPEASARPQSARVPRRRAAAAGGELSWASQSPPAVRRATSTPVKVGAAFGENLPVETTPVKAPKTPTRMTRIEPTPEKNAVPSPQDADAVAGAVAGEVAARSAVAAVARGIAQSGSYSAARKRMISFSPERSPRPENRALALRKLEKNLKANEKLQMRLEGTPVKTPIKRATTASAFTSPSPAPVNLQRSFTMASPMTAISQASSRRSPAKSPGTIASSPMPISQTVELTYEPLSQQTEAEQDKENIATPCKSLNGHVEVTVKDQDFAEPEEGRMNDNDDQFGGVPPSQTEDGSAYPASEIAFSQESVDQSTFTSGPIRMDHDDCESSVDNSAVDENAMPESQISQSEPTAGPADSSTASNVAWAENADVFTSTSVIEDVGLFNCETDVEYTGGVYGEGTDGKVCAAVIAGQKVALKRAKPHEGFPEEEAKRRSAIELHYLRRVRHMKGFLQCLGLCDGIEHTCIALEVMDCKLSDYLRNYGIQSTVNDKSAVSAASVTVMGGNNVAVSSGKKRRRFTLPVEDARAMLRQISLPMITLHDHVNVAHGDLACRNILLRTPPKGYEKSFAPEVKLSDFGRIKVPSSEPRILDKEFSFYKNCDIGSFGREILYRLLVGEIVPPNCLETRSLHKHLTDVVVTSIPDVAKQRLGPFYRLFMRCTGWGVRPSFREIYDHLDDLEYFELSDNGLFPLKPSESTPAPALPSEAATTTAAPAFTSPIPLHRMPSSGSKLHKNALETTPHGGRGGGKPVNWLKTRSVRPSAPAAQALTPNGGRQQQLLLHKKKKTPPSATGPSRRALQIVNQIRSNGGDKKSRKSIG